MKTTTTHRSRAAVLAVAAALVGCHQAAPAGPKTPLAGPRAPQAVPLVGTDGASLQAPPAVAGAHLEETLRIDVDPLHGAAFERPAGRALQAVSVTRSLRMLVDFPSVSHDAATGRTTVTMNLANAGDSLNYLACRVGGDRRVISPAYQWNTTVSKAGQTQTQQLVFDNPTGGGFMVELTFTGYMAATGVVSTGAATSAPSTAPTATPTAAPTTAPTATPTPAPTVAPTASPTAAPSTAPSGGAWLATASSTYGELPASRVLDGDPATQWANDGYQAPSAWLRVDTGARRTMSTLGVKMRPASGGATYRIEVSDDGTSWTAATGPLRNTSWNVEPKALPTGTMGRFFRLVFTNDPASPEARFVVYEVTLNGGGAPAVATPAPTPTPTPAPSSPPATGRLLRTFDAGDPLGTTTADWIDPLDEGWSFSWMPRVTWRVTSHDGSNQFMHDGLRNTADLSFRRYRGTALGTTNGALPARYFMEVDVTPIKSYTYAPTGDQGTQFYYVDPKNYFEIVIKPNYFEAWSAIDAEPFQSRGWTRLFYSSVNTAAGQTRKIACEVDTTTNQVKLYMDGALMGTVSSSVVHNRPHWAALRGTGNIVVHDNIKVEPR